MKLDEKLVSLRKEKGLTQLKVAEELDISRQAISRWESGVAMPSTENLRRISELYRVPLDYLINEDIINSQSCTFSNGKQTATITVNYTAQDIKTNEVESGTTTFVVTVND